MPLYKLFCIAVHYPEFKHIKDLVTQSANIVFKNGGAVRAISSLGTRVLPQKIIKYKNKNVVGDYWIMHFDASPHTLTQLHRSLRTDTRVIRWTSLKLGEKLDDVINTREKTTRPPIQSQAFAGVNGGTVGLSMKKYA